jgi:dolichyl-phosphate beta-glucosyltransferase
MTTPTQHTPRSQSLVASNLALMLGGVLCLLVVSWLTLQPVIEQHWFRTALLLLVAALAGLVLRGLRRKAYFGTPLSLHQSLSFEVITQMLQAVSPLMPRRTFEAEFMTRETGLPAQLINGWLRSRRFATPFVILAPCVVLLIMRELHWQAAILAVVAGIFLRYSMVSMHSEPDPNAPAVLSRHSRSTLAGLATWGIEATLFILATQSVLPSDEALLLYLLFTGIMEFSFVPLALGIAETAALAGLFYGNAPTALACIALFHTARLLPLLPLGAIYLARYKLRFLDLLDADLIARLVQTQRPAGGWSYDTSDVSQAPRLSVIIPAYNEAERLPGYMSEVLKVLDECELSAEVLVVDDGSSDGTAAYVRSVASQDRRVSLLTQPQNAGKGKAIQRGMQEGRGRYLLFADADGATPFCEVTRLLEAADAGYEIAIGSRRATSDAATRERAGLRALMGQSFYAFVNFLAVPGISDTQCGFKLFRRDCARELFTGLNESGWAFDVEVLYRAQLTGYGIAEVAVDWHEVEGSKVNPVRDAIRMFLAVFRIRRNNAGFLRRPVYDTGNRDLAYNPSHSKRIQAS